MTSRQELEDRVWGSVEPSIEGYDRLIQKLLNHLHDDDLAVFAELIAGQPICDDYVITGSLFEDEDE